MHYLEKNEREKSNEDKPGLGQQCIIWKKMKGKKAMRINLDWVSNALSGKNEREKSNEDKPGLGQQCIIWKKMKGKKAMRINLDWVSNALSGKK